MTKISEDLKKRFCDDYSVPITLFMEPHFTNQIKVLGFERQYEELQFLIDKVFNGSEAAFFDYSAELRNGMIDYIKESNVHQTLQTIDLSNMYLVATELKNIPQKDVFKETNIGKKFISIDLKEANYTSLAFFGREIGHSFPAGNSKLTVSYKDFMGRFTARNYFKESKQLRQAIFGCCNSKRIEHIERYIMSTLFLELQKNLIRESILLTPDDIQCFNKDEIILKIDGYTNDVVEEIKRMALKIARDIAPIKVESFLLEKVQNSKTYIKRFDDGTYKLKCMPKSEAITVTKFMKGIPITSDDLVFMGDGKRLATYLEAPKYGIMTEPPHSKKEIIEQDDIDLD